MNNKPVAWIDPKELDMAVSTSVTKNRQFKSDIPLYVKPQKYCPSENNEAYEKGFIDGMAKQRDSKVQQMVEGYTHAVKEQDESFDRTASHMAGEYVSYKAELTDEEIIKVYENMFGVAFARSSAIDFARAILKKAQEK